MKFYVCQSCGQDFEAPVNTRSCPFCQSTDLSMNDIGGVEYVDYEEQEVNG